MDRDKGSHKIRGPARRLALAAVCILFSTAACGSVLEDPRTCCREQPAPGAPRIQEVSPSLGPSIGGTTLTISGEHFAVGATVYIGGAKGENVDVRSGTLLTVTLPKKPGAAGKVRVIVQNPDGQAASRDDLFAYHAGQLTFPEPILLAEGARAAALGDFNEDGQLDVAIAQVLPSVVQIYLSNGQGGFTPSLGYVSGALPAAVVSGDFNGDRHLDLAVANTTSRDVRVLLGNGRGGFAGSVYPAGPSPTALVAADLNGDSQLDLVAASGSTKRLSVLLNSGAGKLAPPVAVALGGSAGALAVADLNRDGRPDLVYPDAAANKIGVLFGDGLGGLGPASELPTTSQPAGIAIDDWNGDGALDLAVAGSGSDIGLFYGDGRGAFSAAASYPIGASSGAVAALDVNGDHALDLVATDRAGFIARVLLSDGAGGFSVTTYPLGFNATKQILTGDLSGDGFPDLLLTMQDGAHLLLHDGSGGFRARKSWAFRSDSATRPLVAIADFDGDQKLDLVEQVTGLLRFGDGQGRLLPGPQVPTGAGLDTGDLDADGRPDLAVCQSGKVGVFLNQANGQFARSILLAAGATCGRTLGIGDFDADGKQDIVLQDPQRIAVLKGDGAGGFVSLTSQTIASTNVDWLVVGDWNGDGKDDFASNNPQSGYGITVFYSNGNGSFSYSGICVPMYSTSLATGDYNRDGLPDLLASSWDLSFPVSLGSAPGGLACGSGTRLSPPGPGSMVQAISGDFDGDGFLDALVSGERYYSIFFGNGQGAFPRTAHFAGGDWLAAAEDFNGDGKADLVIPIPNNPQIVLNTAP